MAFPGFETASVIAAYLSKISALKPIHTLLFVALFSIISYLSLVDEYFIHSSNNHTADATNSLNNLNSYFLPSSLNFNDVNNWIDITQSFNSLNSLYQNSTHLALLPLRFKTISNNDLSLLPIFDQSLIDSISANISSSFSSSSSHSDSFFIDLVHDSTALNENYLVLDYNNDILESLINNNLSLLKSPNNSTMWKISHQYRIGQYQQLLSSNYKKLLAMIKGAETFDIIIVAIVYLIMYFTFAKLFYDMKRKANSKFWLPLAVLSTNVIAFLFALFVTTKIISLKVSLLSISEGLPFLISIVGFNNMVLITSAVIGTSNNQLLDQGVGNLIFKVIKVQSIPFIRDNLLFIISLIGCSLYASKLEALKNFCILSALFLFFNVLLTFTFFASILALKVEINLIHQSTSIKNALEEEGVDSFLAESVANQTLKDDFVFIDSPNESTITIFKLVVILAFVLFQLWFFKTNWISSSAIESIKLKVNDIHFLSLNIASQFNLNSIHEHHSATQNNNGIVLTVLEPLIYLPQNNFFYKVEDHVVHFLELISGSIRDRFISKFLLLAFFVSSFVNIYLLNAARLYNLDKPIQQYNRMISESVPSTPGQLSRRASFASISSHTTSSSGSYPSRDVRSSIQPIIHEKPIISENDIIETKNQNLINNKSNEITKPPHTAHDQTVNGTSRSHSHPHSHKSHSHESDSKYDHNAHVKKSYEEALKYFESGKLVELSNDNIAELVFKGNIPLYSLEKRLGNNTRAVIVRRKAISQLANAPVLKSSRLPYLHYDYDRVFGACCENVIGYMPLPVGIAGPIVIDGKPYHIPMATTEGCLVASAMRGCKAINAGGGVVTVLTRDGMTRGPCVRFPTLKEAGGAKIWIDSDEGQEELKKQFNSTSRFARLQHVFTALAGTLLYVRFRTTTGDAMGMNMISKGTEHCLKYLSEYRFPRMEVIAVSGNFCTDKKSAAVNWINGRGKSVVAEARIPAEVVKRVLKSDVDALIDLNISKNLIGSAMAGAIGGFNAHAANLVTAVFLATGQDPAQNVESSNCITLMHKDPEGSLQISVSMPSIEVGTIGGGTILDAQNSMLELLGVRGPHPTNPGENARQLAKIVASAVLAGELSLCSALAAGHLVQSHMQHNRAKPAGSVAAPAIGSLAPNTTSSATKSAYELKRLQEGSKICIKS
ncbi:uncharacterized protein ASCRUDRAFT_76682 [Ascoidea rubescens DSM 1968]|uniref:3-hydroxy-3-methylglutaryl coenzyme A reductase n=1 Tax=Ascoidea rubescens DSM 1968 TaxID=1344418 RepID=A0A1D2VET0_9ASCO|nr:hypothetical protein ASCRUDRAFT_76682 [Ascoidea rubescens DSM 1968]ODV60184.1 hypothetical protein ASCRUDRAFT_76682 [Ascoidea rubescens DSM 1968]